MSLKESPEFVKFYLPVLAWMVFIFVLSSVPGSALQPIEFPDAHVIAHSLLYAVLYYLGYRALSHQEYSNFVSKYSPILAFVFVALYGASDEYHQSFTPGRSEELKDWLFDVSSALVIMLAVVIADRIRDSRRRLGSN